MAASTASVFFSASPSLLSVGTLDRCNNLYPSLFQLNASDFMGARLLGYLPKSPIVKKLVKVSAVAAPAIEEVKEYKLPTWAEFEIGKAPVFWKTMNGLLPTSGEKLTLFYNPSNKLALNDEFGIGFNGGFNQPIMCGGEPRTMTRKIRGKADPPIFTIKICVPRHAVNLIFSFTNGEDWDGPYKLQFQVPKMWRNKPMSFFNEGLAQELSKEGACDRAIFPDSNRIITRCAMIGNLSIEGGDRCNLNLVPGCTDPSSPDYNPLANVDDGSCPLEE